MGDQWPGVSQITQPVRRLFEGAHQMTLKSASKLLTLILMAWLLVACNATSEGTEVTEPVAAIASNPVPTREPEPAPDFTLTTLDGNTVSLSDYEGEWVLLNFWATWCPPCIVEMPYLQTLADRGLNVLGVNMAEPEENVELFTIRHGITFPILMEPDDILVLDYQARTLPRTVIIAPDGTMALRITGPIDGEQLDPWLAKHGVL